MNVKHLVIYYTIHQTTGTTRVFGIIFNYFCIIGKNRRPDFSNLNPPCRNLLLGV